MKYIIISLLLIVITYTSQAQLSVGADIGSTYNHLGTDISNRVSTISKNEYGYNFNFLAKYTFSNLLSMQTGVGLLQKKYSLSRTGDYAGIYETFTNSYIQVPIAMQLRIIEKNRFQLFFNAGVYGAYWAFAKVNGVTPNIFNNSSTIGSDGQITQYLSLTNYSEKYQFDDTKDNRFEFGLNAGISVHYLLNENYSIFLKSNYYRSLTDQQKKYMVNQVAKINQTLSVSIGCFMKLSATKK